MVTFLLFLFGICIGSFLGVIIDRLPRNSSIVKGRSHCDQCGHILQWYDLIPLVSFVYLQGKCRYCKKFIGWKYPLVELTTGLLFIFIGMLFPYQSNYGLDNKYFGMLAYFLCLFCCFIVIFFTDLWYGIIPDGVVFFASAIIVLYMLFTSYYLIPYNLFAALGVFVFFFFLFLLTRGKGMGFGDVKLSFMLGLLLGWPKIFLAIYVAFLTGAVVALILVVCGRKRFFGGTIPFGPFLLFGAFISWFWGIILWQKIISTFF